MFGNIGVRRLHVAPFRLAGMFGNIGVRRLHVAPFRLAGKFRLAVHTVNPVNFIQLFRHIRFFLGQQITELRLTEKLVAHQLRQMRLAVKFRPIRHIRIRLVKIALACQIHSVKFLALQVFVKSRLIVQLHLPHRRPPFFIARHHLLLNLVVMQIRPRQIPFFFNNMFHHPFNIVVILIVNRLNVF